MAFADLSLGQVLVKAVCTPTHSKDSNPQTVNYFVAQTGSHGQSQTACDTGLHQSTSQEVQESTNPVASFKQHQSRIQLTSQAA